MGNSGESTDHAPGDVSSYPPAVQPDDNTDPDSDPDPDLDPFRVGVKEHLDRITDGFFVLNANWEFTYLNQRAEEVISPDDEDLIGMTIWEQFPEAEDRKFGTYYRKAMREQRAVEFTEYYPEPLDAWFEIHVYPSEDGLSVFFQDVSEQKRQEEHLKRITECYKIVRDIAHEIVDVDERDQVEERTCDRLISNDLPFSMAWVGTVQHGANEIRPTYSAGDDTGYLNAIMIPMDDEGPESRGPARQAVRTHESQVISDIRTDETIKPWRQANLNRGYHSMIAIPLVYNEFLYGLLAVYSPEAGAFDDEVGEILTHLGELVGHTIHSLEQDKALSEDAVITELKYRNERVGRRFSQLLEDFGSSGVRTGNDDGDGDGEDAETGTDQDQDIRIEVERSAHTNDTTHAFLRVDGISPNAFMDAFSSLDHVVDVSLVRASADGDAIEDLESDPRLDEPCDGCLFLAKFTEDSLTAMIDRYDGRAKSLVVDDNGLRLVVEVPPTVDVSEFTECVRSVYPKTEFVGRRTVEREWTSPADFQQIVETDLSQRQRDILETAHMAGYFESPREHTGEEVAEMLGVSGATFSQHLRTGQRKLFDAIF